MKKLILIIALVHSGMLVQAQVNNYGAISGNHNLTQKITKEITEYRVKEYIIKEVINITEGEIVDIEIDALTASKSGELSTVIYQCKSKNKKGIVFVFWQYTFNEFNTKYKGYSFRHIEFTKAEELFQYLAKVMKYKNDIGTNDQEWNTTFLWQDLYFLFYNDGESNKIRVFWNGFDAEWNHSNLKTTSRRFTKSTN